MLKLEAGKYLYKGYEIEKVLSEYRNNIGGISKTPLWYFGLPGEQRKFVDTLTDAKKAIDEKLLIK